jgi:iron complex outermembrane receptor protein
MNVSLIYLRGETSRGVLIGVALAALSFGTAVAQDQPPASGTAPTDSAGQPMEEIVVTGSLFKRTKAETASPVTTLTPEVLQTQGIISISDAIRSLAADNSGTIPTAFGNGFAAGSSGVALRGLTVNSTLVLIDGQRTANYALADDGVRGFVDLNTIPFGVLDRVETLKDGASSEYGADAIGGVVNIILKKTFEGAELTTEVGDSQEGGGFQTHYNALLGYGNLDRDKFNFYINLEGETDDKISVGQRGYPFNTQNLTQSGGPNGIGGQPGVGNQPGSVFGTVQPGTITGKNVLTGIPIAGSLYRPLDPCGAGTTKTAVPGEGTYCAQNFSLDQDDQPQQARLGSYARFTVQPTDDINAYLSLSYFQNRVVVNEIPGQAQNTTPLNTETIALPARLPNGKLNPNNPYAALGEAALLNYSFGNNIPSENIEFNHVYRSVLDVNGTVGDWNFDAAAVLSHTVLNDAYSGLINGQQLVTDVTDGTYNFINPAANSRSVIGALSPLFTKVSTSDLDSIQIQATHPLWTLPGGPMNFGMGFGGRYEAVQDPNINPGNEFQGLGQATTNGYRTVANFYLELDMPVIETVDLNLSGRYDHYSDFGDAFSPKAALKWTAMDGLIFRSTFSQGFRAPSFSEAGSSSSTGFVTYTPPPSFVAAHGSDAYVQPYNLAEGIASNKNLSPEKSTSFTLGTVYEPVPQFSISIDYYNIKKSDLIEPGNYGTALADYYAGIPIPAGYTVVTDSPDPKFPGALARPVFATAPFINAEFLRTDGIDFDIRGRFDLPYDVRLTSTVSFTDILNYEVTQPGGLSVSYLGYQSPYNLSSGAGTPQYKGNWTNSFDYGPFNATLTWNYTSGIKEIANDIAPGSCFEVNPNTGKPYPYGCSTKAFQDFDLTGSWQINDQWLLYGAILNLFNTPPPFDPMDYAGINYNPTYAQAGIIGRFFRLGMTYKFAPGEPESDASAPYEPPPAVAPAPSVPHSYLVFFDFNKSDLTPQATQIVNQAAANAGPAKVTQLTVTGHTDTVGSDAYNMRLSRRRAESVAAQLEKDGIPSSEIAIVAKGKRDLLVPTADGVKEPQNRRVQIVYDNGATS